MFETIALQLIRAMGHHGTVPGAIAAEDVSAALRRLEDKLAGPEIDRPDASEDEQSNEEQEPRVSLAHRALPLTSMLRSAVEEGDYVIWE